MFPFVKRRQIWPTNEGLLPDEYEAYKRIKKMEKKVFPPSLRESYAFWRNMKEAGDEKTDIAIEEHKQWKSIKEEFDEGIFNIAKMQTRAIKKAMDAFMAEREKILTRMEFQSCMHTAWTTRMMLYEEERRRIQPSIFRWSEVPLIPWHIDTIEISPATRDLFYRTKFENDEEMIKECDNIQKLLRSRLYALLNADSMWCTGMQRMHEDGRLGDNENFIFYENVHLFLEGKKIDVEAEREKFVYDEDRPIYGFREHLERLMRDHNDDVMTRFKEQMKLDKQQKKTTREFLYETVPDVLFSKVHRLDYPQHQYFGWWERWTSWCYTLKWIGDPTKPKIRQEIQNMIQRQIKLVKRGLIFGKSRGFTLGNADPKGLVWEAITKVKRGHEGDRRYRRFVPLQYSQEVSKTAKKKRDDTKVVKEKEMVSFGEWGERFQDQYEFQVQMRLIGRVSQNPNDVTHRCFTDISALAEMCEQLDDPHKLDIFKVENEIGIFTQSITELELLLLGMQQKYLLQLDEIEKAHEAAEIYREEQKKVAFTTNTTPPAILEWEALQEELRVLEKLDDKIWVSIQVRKTVVDELKGLVHVVNQMKEGVTEVERTMETGTQAASRDLNVLALDVLFGKYDAENFYEQ